MKSETGFTLVEVLVALAITAVALAACVRALGLGTQGTQAVRDRTLALTAAENRLAELRLQQAFPSPGSQREDCPMGNLALVCEQRIQAVQHAAFRQVILTIRHPDGHRLIELRGLLPRRS